MHLLDGDTFTSEYLELLGYHDDAVRALNRACNVTLENMKLCDKETRKRVSKFHKELVRIRRVLNRAPTKMDE